MTVVDMRERIKAVYPGPAWKRKVSQMSDAQVTAIFLKMQKEGKI